MTTQAIAIQTLNLPASVELLADNTQYTNRFNLTSGSGNVYLIAQRHHNPTSGKGGWWACDCKGYRFARKDSVKGKTCKHLTDLGLPGKFEPFFIGQLSVGGSTPTPLRAIDGGASPKPARKKATRRPAAKPVAAAPAPLALTTGVTPTNVNMVDGKMVVEFDMADSAKVFALLAELAAK
jgi:hypothetical protein